MTWYADGRILSTLERISYYPYLESVVLAIIELDLPEIEFLTLYQDVVTDEHLFVFS